jgi:hypothetical protein
LVLLYLIAVVLVLVTAGCQGSQFVVGWRDRSGNRPPDGRSASNHHALVVDSRLGPQHCDWTSITFLSLSWPVGTVAHPPDESVRGFVRDPRRKLSAHLVGSFARTALLPRDAQDAGFRRRSWRLYVAADGDAVFLVRGGRVERWPREPTGVGCS